jgi:hypothetical protein
VTDCHVPPSLADYHVLICSVSSSCEQLSKELGKSFYNEAMVLVILTIRLIMQMLRVTI